MNLININNVEIIFPQDENGTYFVPVKPICEVLGIDSGTQIKVINGDPLLFAHKHLIKCFSRDMKRYKMVCLPISHALTWILGIDSRNVNQAAKESLLKHQKELYRYINEKLFLSEVEYKQDKAVTIANHEATIFRLKTELEGIDAQIAIEIAKLHEIKETDFSQGKLF